MNNGWIKIHRKLLEWEWYNEPNTFRLFFHLLLKANHTPKRYKGVMIETGEVMTGLNLLSIETGLTVQQVRTSITRLKSTNEITSKTNSQGSIIQIVNYKKYQIVTNEITTEQQTSNKRLTTNKNDKNIKNEKKEINNKAHTQNCLGDSQWLEVTAMQNKIDMVKLKEILCTFENSLITKGIQHESLKEFKSHFANWLNLQPKQNGNNTRIKLTF